MAESDVLIASPVTSTGGIDVAPLGSTLPTNPTTALDAAFIPLGLIAEDGLRPSGDAATTKDFFAWGGDQVASFVENKATKKFTFTLLNLFNEDVNNLVYGDANVTVTAAGSGVGTRTVILDKGTDITNRAMAFTMKFGGKKVRFVAPVSSIVVLSELAYVHTEMSGYEVEVTCLPDGSGVRIYRYFEDDDATA